MVIPLPHPGQSYNRALSDHQAILRQTLEKLEKEQQEADQAAEIKGPVTAGVNMTLAQSLLEKPAAMVKVMMTRSKPHLPNQSLAKRKAAKKKTTAQRGRQGKEREQATASFLTIDVSCANC